MSDCQQYCDISFEQCYTDCKRDPDCIQECDLCTTECEECVKACEGNEECERRCTCNCEIEVDECIKLCEGNELCIRECNLCDDQCFDVVAVDRQKVNGAAGSLDYQNIGASIGVTIGCITALAIGAVYVHRKRSSKRLNEFSTSNE